MRVSGLRLMTAVAMLAVVAGNGSVLAQEEKGAAAGAGIPSPVPLTRASCSLNAEEIAGYIAQFGDYTKWAALQESLTAKVKQCTDVDAVEASPFLVTVVGAEESFTVVVPQPERYSPYLLGVRQVRVLLLIERHDKEETAIRPFRITSTEAPSDLLGKLPNVAGQVIGAVAGGLFPALATGGVIRATPAPLPPQAGAPPPPPPPYEAAAYATTGPVLLPARNAGGELRGRVSVYKVSDEDASKAEDIEVKATFANKAKTRATYSMVAGALVGNLSGDERMKVTDAGKYASDPLARSMTMVAVAFHPWSFDSTVKKMSVAERFALLVGGVITPAPGVGAGISLGVVRGFALTAGGVIVSVATSQGGARPKDEAPEGNHQLRYGWNRGFFLGGGYVFKGN